MSNVLLGVNDLREASDEVIESVARVLEELAEWVRDRKVRVLTIDVDKELPDVFASANLGVQEEWVDAVDVRVKVEE